MKTIEVEDTLHEQLLAIAQQVAEQDNRGTAKPYLFQIRTDYKVFDENLNGETMIILDADYDEVGELNKETILKICHWKEIEPPEWAAELDSTWSYSWLCWDLKEWLQKHDYRLTSYSIAHKYENGFFTAQGCQQHINANRHHYDNPVDYLSHAFRNPEMDLMYKFLNALAERSATQTTSNE